jgi:hypothetical protein
MTMPKGIQVSLWLGVVAVLLNGVLSAAPEHNATGQYEIYCDGVGLFLRDIEGAPAPRMFLLFSYLGFPGGTFAGRYIGEGKWSNVSVFRDGCLPDGKCEEIAKGKVWIDEWDKSTTDQAPNHISGKYEIELNGKHLEGKFAANQHISKHPVRICM